MNRLYMKWGIWGLLIFIIMGFLSCSEKEEKKVERTDSDILQLVFETQIKCEEPSWNLECRNVITQKTGKLQLELEELANKTIQSSTDLVDKGNATFLLGDFEEAFEWFSKGDSLENRKAQYNLGLLLQYGVGVEKDEKKAFRLYRQATRERNPSADFSLGFMWEEGKGTSKDVAMAYELYLKAANQGHSEAQMRLAYFYSKGIHINQNLKKAFKWCLASAKQNNAIAQSGVGIMYYQGKGVMQDYDEGWKWLQKAVSQGNAAAHTSFGHIYFYGEGVDRDYEKALEFYKKGYELRDVESLYGMQRACEKGAPKFCDAVNEIFIKD